MNDLVATEAIKKESSDALTIAQNLKVVTNDDYLMSATLLQGVKVLQKRVADTFDKHIANAFKAHKDLVADKNSNLLPLTQAEALIKRAVLGYQVQQETVRRAAEAAAQEESRKEREKLEARAVRAAASGKVEKAEALQVAAASVVTPMIATTTPRIAGLSTRVTYKATLVDKLELVKACAAGIVPLNALDVNMPFLNNQARQMKETLAYPGVKVEQETGLASRSA